MATFVRQRTYRNIATRIPHPGGALSGAGGDRSLAGIGARVGPMAPDPVPPGRVAAWLDANPRADPRAWRHPSKLWRPGRPRAATKAASAPTPSGAGAGTQMRGRPRGSPLDRFHAAYHATDGHWIWQLSRTSTGSPTFWDGKRNCTARRWIYTQTVGPVPAGKTIAVTCAVQACVNPDHLVPDISAAARQRAARTHCVNGHAYTEANTARDRKGCRQCRTCVANQNRAYHARQRAKGTA